MRHLKPKPELCERLCPFCPEYVETEQHFLLYCKTFNMHRNALYHYANTVLGDFEQLTDNIKFVKLASDTRITKKTAQYLRKTFEIRDFLLEQHKMSG